MTHILNRVKHEGSVTFEVGGKYTNNKILDTFVEQCNNPHTVRLMRHRYFDINIMIDDVEICMFHINSKRIMDTCYKGYYENAKSITFFAYIECPSEDNVCTVTDYDEEFTMDCNYDSDIFTSTNIFDFPTELIFDEKIYRLTTTKVIENPIHTFKVASKYNILFFGVV